MVSACRIDPLWIREPRQAPLATLSVLVSRCSCTQTRQVWCQDFPTGGRTRERRRCLNLISSAFLIPFPVWFHLNTSTTPLWPGCRPTGWNMWREEDNGQNYNTRHTVKGEGGDKYEAASRSPACLRGQLLWDVCLCSPGPGALTPDWADLDKKQLSLPHSSPHPRGRCTALYTTALDSIKPEQSHLLLHLQPL